MVEKKYKNLSRGQFLRKLLIRLKIHHPESVFELNYFSKTYDRIKIKLFRSLMCR